MSRRISILAAVALLMGVSLWLLTPRRLEPAAKPLPGNAASIPPSATATGTVPVTAGAAPAREEIPAEPAEPAATTATVATHESVASTHAAIIPAGPANANARALEMATGPELAPGLTPAIVLENVRQVFHQFNSRFGGNPVGNNPEITAALNGGNPRQVIFLNPEDGMRINERGELIDNWGTPFFFHQLSRTEMEIRSAGPDRKMWTADDLVIK